MSLKTWSFGHMLLLVVAAAAALACNPVVHRFDRTTVAASLSKGNDAALVIGEFPLMKVTDGDTIRVAGLDASMRLLGLDTEETFKRKSEYMEFDKGWERYLAEAQAKTKSPVKIPTPMGEEAKKYAEAFFHGVRTVRLERDHPKEIRDFYNRYLAYVFVEKDGKTYNYNVECVRAGMSPYFSKYGYSRRFHKEFVAAQEEARAAKRGIWDPSKQHYTDYDRRLEWWNRRGDFIQAFELQAADHPNWIVLTHWDALDRLQGKVGREVVILGAIGDVRETAGPTKVLLSRRRTGSLPLIFFDKDVLARSGAVEARGEFVVARGVITKYFNKYKKQDELQIVVTMPGQIQREVLAPVDETETKADAEPAPEPAPQDSPAPEGAADVAEPEAPAENSPNTAKQDAADARADAIIERSADREGRTPR
ncbi:thermonuclease family protein [Nannocystis bainbridge]|uniref:Thermonuclease family protein n=1 Tax=Nannocystis bainbridge TaxID=2995303 RepID=A0ABT5DQ57_9BACT|nr:thermonuclease family protein [Nannocystis bainbridge]MDC0715729.1 thermonuclease family protein [Nannocystis bainbridge]